MLWIALALGVPTGIVLCAFAVNKATEYLADGRML